MKAKEVDCPVFGCGNRTLGGILCFDCWLKVPNDLRAEVYSTHTELKDQKEHQEDPVRAFNYRVARDLAIAWAVNNLEGEHHGNARKKHVRRVKEESGADFW